VSFRDRPTENISLPSSGSKSKSHTRNQQKLANWADSLLLFSLALKMEAIFSYQAVSELYGVTTWKTILFKRTSNLTHWILCYQKQNCEFIAKKVLRRVSGQHTLHLGKTINKMLWTEEIGSLRSCHGSLVSSLSRKERFSPWTKWVLPPEGILLYPSSWKKVDSSLLIPCLQDPFHIYSPMIKNNILILKRSVFLTISWQILLPWEGLFHILCFHGPRLGFN
jgi:hypothetical protein